MAAHLLPLPACGERVGVRGASASLSLWKRPLIPTFSPQAGGGELAPNARSRIGRMTKRKKDDDYAAPQLADEVGRWLAHLAAERRMSAKTVEAYGRDMRQFLAFLAGHFGTRVTLARLCDLAPSDVRAFMAL